MTEPSDKLHDELTFHRRDHKCWGKACPETERLREAWITELEKEESCETGA